MAFLSCIFLMFLVTNVITRNNPGPLSGFLGFMSVVVFPAIAAVFAVSEFSDNALLAGIYALTAVVLLVNALFVTKIVRIGGR